MIEQLEIPAETAFCLRFDVVLTLQEHVLDRLGWS